MFFPKLNDLPTESRRISTFGGLELRHAVAEGNFAWMENLTSDAYPLLMPRAKRSVVAKTGPLGGMIAKDALCYVNKTAFVINGNAVEMGLTPGEKQLVSMGAYVVIFPDKKYINTLDTDDRGSLEATWTSQGSVSFSICNADGSAMEDLATGQQPPEGAKDRQYWLDTSGSPCVLRQYSSAAETWVEVNTCCVRIQAAGIGKDFSQYDGVEIAGIAAGALQSLNGAAVLQAVGEDYIVIPGILGNTVTQDPDQGAVTVRRSVPEMDFVIEASNRLWGCRYGFDRAGNVVNALYACKLGDFKNWQCFSGLSTDSYEVSLGADGPFTGAITHLGYPLFFREGCLHKVYGSYPANFQVQTTACRGVAQGSHKSLAIVDGVLYYLGAGGVCAYDGSLPEVVSAVLGQISWHSGVAGALGSKYYICMADDKDRPGVYVLDTANRLWHREDDLAIREFCSRGESLFCHDGETLWDMAGLTGTQSKAVQWMAQTGFLASADPGMRYINRITARLSLELGSTIRFYARYADCPGWHCIGSVRGNGLRTLSLPMRTRRCESLQLRIEGKGEARLYSLTVTSQKGSDTA